MVLCYKPEGRWFDPRWCHWIFNSHKVLKTFDSSSNRNEYQEHFLGGKGGRRVRLTTYYHTVPLSRNLGTLTSCNPLGPSGSVTGLLYHFFRAKEWGSDLILGINGSLWAWDHLFIGRCSQQIGLYGCEWLMMVNKQRRGSSSGLI